MEQNRAASPQLMIDFITSLDGYASAIGWPGWWGLEGPEYLQWLDEQPERDYTLLMGATTYRLMWGFASEAPEVAFEQLNATPKIVFSSTLEEPLAWANSRLVTTDAVEAVRETQARRRDVVRAPSGASNCADRSFVPASSTASASSSSPSSPARPARADLRRLSRCRARTDRSRTFDGRIQLLDYVPTLLDGPPGSGDSG